MRYAEIILPLHPDQSRNPILGQTAPVNPARVNLAGLGLCMRHYRHDLMLRCARLGHHFGHGFADAVRRGRS